MVEPENVVLKLLQYFNSQSALAEFCMVDRSAVTHWKINNKIPVWHIEVLHRETGIPKWELRPDVFKKEVE